MNKAKGPQTANGRWSQVIIVILALLPLRPLGVVRAHNPNSKLYSENKTELGKIEKYINSTKSIEANFIQIQKGKVSSGKFFLQKPGKLKLYYTKGEPITVIVKDGIVTYYDRKLDQISQKAEQQTISSIILTPKFNFRANNVRIVKFKNQDKGVILSIQKTDSPEEGIFTIYLAKHKFQQYIINKMEVSLPHDQAVSINLSGLRINEKIPDSEFSIVGYKEK